MTDTADDLYERVLVLRCQAGDGDASSAERVDTEGDRGAHSMISPRSRNLAIADELTKPKRAISNAASK